MTEIASQTDEGAKVDSKDNSIGVKVVEFDGVIERAFNRDLPTPLPYRTTFEELQSYDAIPAKEMPDQDDVLTLVNNKRKANARQKVMNETLDAAAKAFTAANPGKDNPFVKPTLESSDDLKVKNIVDSLLASKKYDKDQATALAKQMLGLA